MNQLIKITSSILLIILVYSCKPVKTSQTGERWTTGKAWEWYDSIKWITGANFIPSTAVNQLEMWQAVTFDPVTIDCELGYAEGIGFNTVRVSLHSFAWKQDPGGFLQRLDNYLTIADRHGIRTIFVFFDDCWNENSKPGPQPEPLPGIHNSGWIQDPSCDLRTDTISLYKWLEEYVKDVLYTFGDDHRVLAWDLYNEPGNTGHLNTSLPLLKNVFRWSRETDPSQPVTAGIWQSELYELNEFQASHSDIITYHNYSNPNIHMIWLGLLKTHGRPMICTEYMARHFNSKFKTILPILKNADVGAINWGLVAGKTNTIYKWNEPIPSGDEPELWFHDIFRKDGTPYDPEETELVKRLNEEL